MADNITLNTMSGGSIAASDERTISGATVHIQRTGEIGSATLANGQVAPTATAATLLAARDTRKRVTFLNAGTVDVYIGIATVTTANGFKLVPGSAMMVYTTALLQAITASGTGAIHYIEEYD
jgi:hypothetical protein